MCLTINRTQQLKKDVVTCYKVLMLWSPFLGLASELALRSIHYQSLTSTWTPGVKVSNRRSTPLVKLEKSSQCVWKGIHVFRSKKAALGRYIGYACRTELPRHYRIVPVRCEKKDLVAIGTRNEAVFRKVTLTQRAYDEAMKPTV